MNRIAKIDFLRGLSIIIMIFLHTSADVIRGEKITYFLWDFLHLAVPLFLFCSAYVLVKKYKEIKGSQILTFYKKRITRLLIPYYIFLPFYLLILYLEWKHLSTNDFVSSIFLYGGPGINWLILLFVELTLLFPLFLWLKKYKYGILSIFFLSMLSSILLNFWIPQNVDYRVYMVLPWLMPFLVAFFYEKLEKNMVLRIFLTVIFFLLFIIQRHYFETIHHTLVLQWNKFPPDFYYLSYDMAALFAFDIIGDLSLWSKKYISSFFKFFSVYSYSIFFIHFLVIEFIYRIYFHTSIDKVPWNAYQFFAVVLGVTIILQILYLKVKEKISPKRITII